MSAVSDDELDEWARLADKAAAETGEWKGPDSWAFVNFTTPSFARRVCRDLRKLRDV